MDIGVIDVGWGRHLKHHNLIRLQTTPPMPPIPQSTPRIVIYYQTLHHPDGSPCSILPIITQPNISVTHINLAAIHLNDPPGNITLVGPARDLHILLQVLTNFMTER